MSEVEHVYAVNPPELTIASDASPAWILRQAMRRLSRRWLKRFDRLSGELGEYFATEAAARSDLMMRAALRKAGFTVRFTMTRAQNDVIQATIGEQVALIKSIAQEHLADVEGLVMRSVQSGRDLGALSDSLRERYDVTKKRAALIARDQNNKATAALQRARQLELMPDPQGIWIHSHAGKKPRPSHVAFNGKQFSIRDGALIDGERILPGQKINCRCTWRLIVKGLT